MNATLTLPVCVIGLVLIFVGPFARTRTETNYYGVTATVNTRSRPLRLGGVGGESDFIG